MQLTFLPFTAKLFDGINSGGLKEIYAMKVVFALSLRVINGQNKMCLQYIAIYVSISIWKSK